MDAPMILSFVFAAAAAILMVFGLGIFCALAWLCLGIHGMAVYTGKRVSDTWKRWRLRAWWNRANRFRYRKHAKDLNGLRCPASIPDEPGFVDSKTIAALRRRAGA